MPPINFGSNFLKTISIPHKSAENQYSNSDVAIVELDENDCNDTYAVGDAAIKWDNVGKSFGLDIYSEMLKPDIACDSKKEHYLAITEQESGYKYLNPNKIIALAMFSEKKGNTNKLNWLQVNPSTNKENSQNRSFKHVGVSMLDFIKNNYSSKPIYVESTENSASFYTKNKFEAIDKKHPYNLIWMG